MVIETLIFFVVFLILYELYLRDFFKKVIINIKGKKKLSLHFFYKVNTKKFLEVEFKGYTVGTIYFPDKNIGNSGYVVVDGALKEKTKQFDNLDQAKLHLANMVKLRYFQKDFDFNSYQKTYLDDLK